MVKRKRHAKTKDFSNVKMKFERKRGRLVVGQESELDKTTKELHAELQKLKEMKNELRKAKGRRNRQPAPIQDRKALDHMPVDAGARVDRRTRLDRRAERADRRAKKAEKRERLRLRNEARGAEEVDFKTELGSMFFEGTDGDVQATDKEKEK
eukprot:TRINITY_DN68328_c0_g1_i1.p1 TRINITY_DN68328_c0_g1~~TRINITY_DN68328_c0_g1_i1.p1  ORF type:complete len:153 (+),score=37.80 TRINITY_DN68328_c0_g1_i1:90-548(+)